MKVRFQASPSPDLFPSDEPVIPQGRDESLKDVRCKGQWDVRREKVDTRAKGNERGEPRVKE